METQHIPSAQATDAKGVTCARVTPTQFPSDASGNSALVHRITSYDTRAWWGRMVRPSTTALQQSIRSKRPLQW
jgi:hypothetical protein